jgi:hypothetical protein
MSTTATLTDDKELKVRTFFTADLRSDAGYRLLVIPAAGIKTINGKKLVREAIGPEPPG